MRLIALKEILLHKPGDEFEIGDQEGRALVALQIAKEAPEKYQAATVEPMTTANAADLTPPRRRYRRRDMKPER